MFGANRNRVATDLLNESIKTETRHTENDSSIEEVKEVREEYSKEEQIEITKQKNQASFESRLESACDVILKASGSSNETVLLELRGGHLASPYARLRGKAHLYPGKPDKQCLVEPYPVKVRDLQALH